jgi:hypothetical protein
LKRLCVLLILVWNLASASFAQSTAPNSSKEPLTIESIFAEGGITGRAPEAVQWSPDGKKLTFVARDDAGEDLTDRRGGILRIEPSASWARPEVICTG